MRARFSKSTCMIIRLSKKLFVLLTRIVSQLDFLNKSWLSANPSSPLSFTVNSNVFPKFNGGVYFVRKKRPGRVRDDR
jgi:hypothetical protein